MQYVFDPETLCEVAHSHRKHPPRTAAFSGRAWGREQEGNERGLTGRYRWPSTP